MSEVVGKIKNVSVMKKLDIEKVVVNICVGNNKNNMDKAKLLLEKITNKKPTICCAKRRLATWQIRPGLPIGYKVTLRYEDANKFLKWIIESMDRPLKENSIDKFGNFAIGIQEYLNLKGIKYDPDIGILGFEVMVNFKRPGFRNKVRRYKKSKIPLRHKVSKEEVVSFLKENFKLEVQK